MNFDRRQFLEFMGIGAGAALGSSFLSGCALPGFGKPSYVFKPLKATSEDDLVLAEGFKYRKLISWEDPLNSKGEKFGFNNDYIAVFPIRSGSQDHLIMWVNHEYSDSVFINRLNKGEKRLKKHVDAERRALGGSLLEIRKNDQGVWEPVSDSKFNRRITAFTKIPFSNGEKIMGQNFAIGTFANCAGGVTPWGTVLTCEENYDGFVGEVRFGVDGKRELFLDDLREGWTDFYKLPPEHYGWVVEVNPKTGHAQKHIGMGRMAHECATTTLSKSGQLVVYTGDDSDNEHIYKFISKSTKSLKAGTLYVANTQEGRWSPLQWDKDPRFKTKFKNQLELLIRTREAAKLVGATPLDRPEDIEIHPVSGEVFVALTNNKTRGDKFGSILKIKEKNGDHSSLEFESSTFMVGGESAGLACPDNMAFDRNGNLWLTTDMSGSVMNNPPFESFKNNSLFFIPMSGKSAGVAHRVASGPVNSELTGPCFSPDGRTLFLSVQHPGEGTVDVLNPLSHWPEGGNSTPKPSVVAIDIPASF